MNIRNKSGVREELLALKNENGLINPARAVDWARNNDGSLLYAELEWNDEIAGEKYRVQQVRAMIAVYTVDASGGREFVSLSIDRQRDGTNGYRQLHDIFPRQDLREVMLKDALADLQRMEAKYGIVGELNTVWEALREIRRRRPGERLAEAAD